MSTAHGATYPWQIGRGRSMVNRRLTCPIDASPHFPVLVLVAVSVAVLVPSSPLVRLRSGGPLRRAGLGRRLLVVARQLQRQHV